MKRSSNIKLILGALICAVVLINEYYFEPEPVAELPRFGTVPQFSLTNAADGGIYESKSLLGKTTLLNFFFTSCPTVCPAVNGRIATLNRIYKDYPNFQIVSITVDPETDTPAKLREYAERFGSNLTKWHFLTGEPSKIIELRRDGFKVDPAVNADMHSTRVILIDRTGTVRGFYSGDQEQSMKELAWDLQKVLNP